MPGPWKAAWPAAGCLLEYVDATGAPASLALAAWESGQVISAARCGGTPVLAWPVPGTGPAPPGDGALRPAGGLEPGEDGTVSLAWRDGAAALVALRVAGAGRDLSLFNVLRLVQEMREVPDPWDLDLPAMASAIAEGTFTLHDRDLRPERAVAVPAGAGAWFLESPLRPPASADEKGELRLELSLGLHSLWGPGTVILMQVTASEVVVGPARADARAPAGARRPP